MPVVSQNVQNADIGAVAAKQAKVPRQLWSSSAALAGTICQPDVSVIAWMASHMALLGIVTCAKAII